MGQIPIPKVYRMAGLDLGSNAVRMSVAETFCPQFYRIVKYSRKPLRLGESVFSHGHISKQAFLEGIEYFLHFRDLFWKYKVDYQMAVATSALREAKNQNEFVQTIKEKTGIEIEVISGTFEAELISKAVQKTIVLPRGQAALLIDMGGGSVEFTYVLDGQTKAQNSYPMGALRGLQFMQSCQESERAAVKLGDEMRPYLIDFKLNFIKSAPRPSFFVGTGGNFERLGKIEAQMNGRLDEKKIHLSDLLAIRPILEKMPIEDRVEYFKIDYSRADVLIPAAIMLEMILEEFNATEISIPGVGLRHGLLYHLSENISFD